jgi:hypothetical protein
MFVDKVVPHCHVCMEELKIGEWVVMNGLLKGIMHADCNYLNDQEISDGGKYEDIVSRNQRWFSEFIPQ